MALSLRPVSRGRQDGVRWLRFYATRLPSRLLAQASTPPRQLSAASWLVRSPGILGIRAQPQRLSCFPAWCAYALSSPPSAVPSKCVGGPRPRHDRRKIAGFWQQQ